MDLHDELGDGGAQGMWEPPGSGSAHGASAADRGTTDASGYDGSGGYEDGGGDAGPESGPVSGPGAGPDYDDSSGGSDEGGGSGTDGPAGTGTMIVDVDGETRELPAEKDYTGDGRPDAVAETADGRLIVFADNEDNETGAAGPDGRADEAYVVDKQTGQVISAAHLDPASGQWVDDTDEPSATEPGTGATSGGDGPGVVTVEGGGDRIGVATPDTEPGARGRAGDPGDPLGAPAGTRSTGPAGGSGTMIVDMDGETRQLPAEKDYTGDGRPDAVAETADGRLIVFSDTEDNETGAAGPDGRADEAYVVDKQTGRVISTAHIDPRTGEWVEGEVGS